MLHVLVNKCKYRYFKLKEQIQSPGFWYLYFPGFGGDYVVNPPVMAEVQNILSQLGGLHAELAVRLPSVNLHEAI